METAERHENPTDARPRASPPRLTAFAAAGALAVVVVWGGYARHWSWTGINGHTATLWDWLHLLLLPVAVALLPLSMSPKTRLTRRHKTLGTVALTVFAVIVIAGYLVPWVWTGFVGNNLWDWLNLIALPLAVSLTPWFRDLRSGWGRPHWMVAILGAVAFLTMVLGGYVWHWGWTGFRGNTLWDWTQLLLLPLLLPTLVVPALIAMAAAAWIIEDEHESAETTRDSDAEAGTDDGAKAGADDGAKAGADDGAKAGADDGAKAGADDGAEAVGSLTPLASALARAQRPTQP
jgi:hypothetical protein